MRTQTAILTTALAGLVALVVAIIVLDPYPVVETPVAVEEVAVDPRYERCEAFETAGPYARELSRDARQARIFLACLEIVRNLEPGIDPWKDITP